MMRPWLLGSMLLMAALAGCAGSEPAATDDGCTFPDSFDTENPVALMCTNRGAIVLELYGGLTPQTVQNFGSLAQDGYYDQVKFHRVIADFMIQGGDPNTKQPESQSNPWGAGGPGYKIIDEFPCNDGNISYQWTDYGAEKGPCDGHGGLMVSHSKAGMLSMANTGNPKTGGSQFFITLGPQPRLDGTHAVFGETIHGMDVVEEIGGTQTNQRDQPVNPVVIESVEIQGDLPGVEIDKY